MLNSIKRFFMNKDDSDCFKMIRKYRLGLWYDDSKLTWIATTEKVQIKYTTFDESPNKAIKRIVKSMSSNKHDFVDLDFN